MNLKKNLKAYCWAVGTGLGAAAASVGLATTYPKVALGLTVGGAFFVGLAIKLPDPPKEEEVTK